MNIIRNRTRAERQSIATTTAHWSPDKLYRRSAENRRILFLEVVTSGIVQLESFRTLAEFQAFEAELRSTREQSWGIRPWRGATSPDRYLEHAADLAREFVAAKGVDDYSSRSITP